MKIRYHTFDMYIPYTVKYRSPVVLADIRLTGLIFENKDLY